MSDRWVRGDPYGALWTTVQDTLTGDPHAMAVHNSIFDEVLAALNAAPRLEADLHAAQVAYDSIHAAYYRVRDAYKTAFLPEDLLT